jgi:hypothetical protein
MTDHAASFDDFTESAYRGLLRRAKEHWQFISFPEHKQTGRAVLWRHDVDFSLHRALALANIEREEGVTSTYFILLNGRFYNPLEKEPASIVGKIAEMGHSIGLHFDPTNYGNRISSKSDLENALIFERQVLENMLGVLPSVFSWHNPTVGDWLSIETENIAGMVNAYSPSIHERYRYVSDSNGIWRHDRLEDVLRDPAIERLQVLTHPAWWVPSPLSPRERIQRAVDGRAHGTMQVYDEDLKRFGRPNIDRTK